MGRLDIEGQAVTGHLSVNDHKASGSLAQRPRGLEQGTEQAGKLWDPGAAAGGDPHGEWRQPDWTGGGMSQSPTLARPRTQARDSARRPEPGDRPVRAAGSGPRGLGVGRAERGSHGSSPTCLCPKPVPAIPPPNRLQQPEQWARAPALHAALALASRWGAFWTGAGGGLGQRERGFHFLTRRAPNPDALCGRERARGHEEAGQRQTFRKELNLEPALRPGPGRPGRQAPPARSHRR